MYASEVSIAHRGKYLQSDKQLVVYGFSNCFCGKYNFSMCNMLGKIINIHGPES